MSEKQKTIEKPVSLSGRGLHTGLVSKVTFHPAPANSGYVFRRTDLEGSPVIKAIIENVTDTSRGTTIEENGVCINTVEHVLAAVYGCDIDNIIIDIDASELPIIDGSAKMFVEALNKAGSVEQDAERKIYAIKNHLTFTDSSRNVEYVAFPHHDYSLNVQVDYNSTVLLNQYASMCGIDQFTKEISCCRTFVFLHELEQLLSRNLIKGGDLDNAIVIVDREITKEELDHLADLFKKPRLEVVPAFGVLNNLELYYNNEPARHKLLDLIGDLALIGVRLRGKIIATRPGHQSNIEFAKIIKQQIKKEKSKKGAPEYNLNALPVLDIKQIQNILPHRPPFLLVDKIIQMDETSVVGVKNVTMNENFFVGHFPYEPVMPGVLIIEAMAQVGGILVLGSVPDPENYMTLFMKVEHVKFKKKVVPGDTLILRMELTSPVRRGIANMVGQAFVGDAVVMEGEMMAQITKIKNK